MNWLGWLLVGFVAGNLVPRRYIHKWRIAVPPFRAIGPWLHRHVVGVAAAGVIIAMLIGAGSALAYGYFWQQGQDRDERQAAALMCQRNVNNALLDALHARSATARGAVLAPSVFFQKLQRLLTHPGLDDDARARLLDELIDANKDANRAYYRYVKTQEANPLPEIPDCSQAGR